MAVVSAVMGGDSKHVDPDAQATVTDFLDYTEYLPSDLTRSLTLIKKLDETYLSTTDNIHNLLFTYGGLPKLPPGNKPALHQVRKQTSYRINYALHTRESAYAEASRLFGEVERHFNRLTSVKSKLEALPKPPSRDPSPIPLQHSPQANRARLARTVDVAEVSGPRITLRLDNARAAASSARQPGTHRPRQRKITVPGEVLPPFNPDSTPPFSDSEWDSPEPSPIPMPTSRVGQSSVSRNIVKPIHVRPPKGPKPPRNRAPKIPRPPRPPRAPGTMGTNVHSAVAGISTSNALSLLTPPPVGTKPGSQHAPWMRLTEYEMALLRKRMKKNAIWTPSETMIRRELSESGRGPDHYRKARAKAEEDGVDILDCDNIATTAPGKALVPGEISADLLGYEAKLSNKGMKLNEAKKLKKELLAREAAATAAMEAEQAALRLGDLGISFKTLFQKSSQPIYHASSSSHFQSREKAATKTPRKRKHDAVVSEDYLLQAQLNAENPVSANRTQPKKRKVVVPAANSTTTPTTTVPSAAPATLPLQGSKATSPPASSEDVRKSGLPAIRPRRISLTIRTAEAAIDSRRVTPRTASRPVSRRESAGPAELAAREGARRKSATPGAVVTAAGRRSKRPAPGPVTNSQDGGAALSVGKRKNAPRKRGTAAAATHAAKKAAEGYVKEPEEEGVLEEIDPDEPRYCLCGDVSYGTMICCENPDCEKEWFHLECVGLQETPGRRTKWYCPDCKP